MEQVPDTLAAALLEGKQVRKDEAGGSRRGDCAARRAHRADRAAHAKVRSIPKEVEYDICTGTLLL
ncbi:hypothetical protein NDU88_010913 [Pleurodeles waltl]|uniref:Uncharacterized protein n=1 Tax=Pleurodeles waltl TaxID=8319 RepID=A0AAV7PW92_PLEWA|nr:hypothetical protein NDU88_010913 [Pleurodeles waltl]